MVTCASGAALSVAAYAKSAEQVSGDYEFVDSGVLTLYALGSATGLMITLKCGGAIIVDDKPLSMFATAGTMKVPDNMYVSQGIRSGRVSLTFRNTTAGALTVDFILDFAPM